MNASKRGVNITYVIYGGQVNTMVLEFVTPLLATVTPIAFTAIITAIGAAIAVGVALVMGQISDKLGA